ncbi:MAG: imidazoleglycerol-phosphate dehydratase HisB [candidate division NC10 bacterium]|nr:imidazoleglycerol-phosphate dehydratase HisB [candidate division NC10 bacterium]HET7853157.1 imidazoleglycerol-phosphate dehydratase HisB [Candidatus Methylomirabilis sp.]
MPRKAKIRRRTTETDVAVELTLDGQGRYRVETGLPFFDHMLAQLAKHGLFNLTLRAKGDLDVDPHHTMEDVGLALGEAFAQALGNRASIRRYGQATVPMDDALGWVAVDMSGRPYLAYRADGLTGKIGEFDAALLKEFFRAFATALKANVHIGVVYGENTHHMAESVFKATGRALDVATALDPRVKGIPSTKGRL